MKLSGRKSLSGKRWAAAFGVFFTVLGISSFEGGSDLPENPVLGSKLFISKGCIKCHAIKGVGGSSGPDLGKVEMNKSLLEMAGIMWSHSPRMSEKLKELGYPRPTFTVKEMSKLMVFIYFLNYFDEPGNPDRGEIYFSTKKCDMCHSIGAEGGTEAPELGYLKKFVSPIFVANMIWNHGPKMVEAMEKRGVPFPEFEGSEMIDLISYIKREGKAGTEQQVLLTVGNPRRGGEIFKAKGCKKCHSIYGDGGDLGPDLGEEENLRRSQTLILTAIWNHGPQMWKMMREQSGDMPNLTTEEMNDLLTYLYFLRYLDRPGDPEKGKRLYRSKGCSNCHSLGEGEAAGPDLTKSKAFREPLEVVTAIWNHLPEMEELMQSQDLPWPTFEGKEMADLIEFVRREGESQDE